MIIRVIGKAILEVPIEEVIEVDESFFDLPIKEQDSIINDSVNWDSLLSYSEVVEFDVAYGEEE